MEVRTYRSERIQYAFCFFFTNIILISVHIKHQNCLYYQKDCTNLNIVKKVIKRDGNFTIYLHQGHHDGLSEEETEVCISSTTDTSIFIKIQNPK